MVPMHADRRCTAECGLTAWTVIVGISLVVTVGINQLGFVGTRREGSGGRSGRDVVVEVPSSTPQPSVPLVDVDVGASVGEASVSPAEVPPRATTHGRPNASPCYVYVYDIPDSLHSVNGVSVTRSCGVRSQSCYSMEIRVVRALNASEYRCTDPSQARWILAPVLMNCAKKVAHYNGRVRWVEKYLIPVMKYYTSTALWKQRAADHIFVISRDQGLSYIRRRNESLYQEVRKALFATVLSSLMPMNPYEVIPGWDIVLPCTEPFLPPADKYVRHELDVDELRQRQRLSFWAGGIGPAHPTRTLLLNDYRNSTTVVLRNDRVKREFFLQNLNSAVFCMMLPGMSPMRWTRTLGSVLQGNCIPLIVADCWTRPFGDVINWTSFAVVMGESEMRAPKGEETLRRAVNESLPALVETYNRVRRKLIFFEPPQKGDAVDTFVAMLRTREPLKALPLRGHAEERMNCSEMLDAAIEKHPLTRDCMDLSEDVRNACTWGPAPPSWRT